MAMYAHRRLIIIGASMIVHSTARTASYVSVCSVQYLFSLPLENILNYKLIIEGKRKEIKGNNTPFQLHYTFIALGLT